MFFQNVRSLRRPKQMLYSEEQINRNWGANLNRFYVHKAGKNVTFHKTKKTSAIFKKY